MAYGLINVDTIQSSSGKQTKTKDLASTLNAIALANNVESSKVSKLVTGLVEGKQYFYDEENDVTYYSFNEITDTITGLGADVDGIRTLTGDNGTYQVKSSNKFTESQEELINGNVFPKKGVLADGMTVPSGTTHLRVLVDGEATIVTMSPVISGVVSLLSDGGSTIGSTPVTFSGILIDQIDNTSDFQNRSLIAGSIVRTTSYHQVSGSLSTPPRGGNEYNIVTPTQYANIRSQTTSVLGILDFTLANGNIALANTDNLSLYHFGGIADYSKVGSVVTATDNTSAIQSALTFCIETATDLDMSCFDEGGFYQVGDIDLTSVVPSVFADSLYIKADAEIETDTTWIFKDSNGVGVELPSRLGMSLERVTIATDADDGRTSLFDKIGISSVSADASFRFVHKYVNVTNFSGAGFRYHDVSTSVVVGGRCTQNAIAYDFGLTFWSALANTTINWRGTYFITNDIGIRGNKVSESLFQGVIFENNRRGFQNASGIKNTFIGCYGENNDQYAYLDLSGASAAFINCFSSGSGDTWECTGDTGSYGFDRIGSAFYDDRFTRTQKINFYDRVGNDAEGLSAQNTTGELQLLEANGTKLGKIGSTYAQRNDGSSLRGSYSFLIADGVVVGEKPDSWTVSKTGTGDYRIDFDVAIRPPLLSISVAPTSQNGISGGQVNLDHHIRIYGTSDWSTFSTAEGLQILTTVGGVATNAKIWVKCDEVLQ